MSTTEHPREIDPVTGTPTTGHEWDGVRELNTPLPRWWLWVFYATIVFSIGYWVVYPSWPLITSSTKGVLGWSSRTAALNEVEALKAQRAPLMDKLAAASLKEIAGDPTLLDFALVVGKRVFADNCAPCHGAGGGGAKGYPNLNDDDWLWGGKLDDIALTITHGARSGDDKGHVGSMPAFGRDGLLKDEQISAVADYVRSLSGLVPASTNVAEGKKVFAEICVTCHGADGKGNRELGAPNLTDAIWLYGSDKAIIMEGLRNGRGGVMPAWGARLDPTTIKALTVFVHTLGGGEK
jgi:cytochrome c oxidase cbb3-type subunit 3